MLFTLNNIICVNVQWLMHPSNSPLPRSNLWKNIGLMRRILIVHMSYWAQIVNCPISEYGNISLFAIQLDIFELGLCSLKKIYWAHEYWHNQVFIWEISDERILFGHQFDWCTKCFYLYYSLIKMFVLGGAIPVVLIYFRGIKVELKSDQKSVLFPVCSISECVIFECANVSMYVILKMILNHSKYWYFHLISQYFFSWRFIWSVILTIPHTCTCIPSWFDWQTDIHTILQLYGMVCSVQIVDFYNMLGWIVGLLSQI